MNQQREQEALLAAQREQELREQEQAAQEKEETPQNSEFRQLIGEVRGTKQNMEDTMLELLEVCRQKEIYCMYNDVDDLIESALNSKLLSINLKSQRLDKENQEVKNIVEQPTKCRTRITESMQNFRVIHKMSSISNTSQTSPVIAIAPDLPTKKPEYSLSMGDEHLNTIPKTESNEVIKSSAENLVPIPSESEVTRQNLIATGPRPTPHGSYHYGIVNFTRTIRLANSAPIINGKQRFAVKSTSFILTNRPLKIADYFKISSVFSLGTISDIPNGGGGYLQHSIIVADFPAYRPILMDTFFCHQGLSK
nr:L-ascorbate oxidase homolog [Tanacetum cinerariifolium]